MHPDSARNRFALEALEPRVLLSGDAQCLVAGAGLASADDLATTISQTAGWEQEPHAGPSEARRSVAGFPGSIHAAQESVVFVVG